MSQTYPVASSRPLVSVVIPAWRSAATIQRALDSVAAQDYRPIEILVVDDCGGDETVARVESWTGHPVRLVRQPQNGGPSRARNAGLRAALGQYVAFLDADDLWRPEKLSRQMALLEEHPGATLIGCQCRRIDAGGNRLEPRDTIPMPSGRDAWKALLERAWIQTSCVVAPRALLLELGGFNETMMVAEDLDLWIRLALRGEAYRIEEELVDFVASPDSFMSRSAHRMRIDRLPMIERHVAANRDRLSSGQARAILGRHYCALGRSLYESGEWGAGLAFILRGIARGHQPLGHLWFLLAASPLLRAVRGR